MATYIPRWAVALNAPAVFSCTGQTHSGRLTGGKMVQTSTVITDGPRAYCWLCKQALRMYAHEKVATSIAWAYNGYLIYQKNAKAFQIGEVGFPWGGRFRPHKTHRNGLSVDIMVPLTTGALPTHIGNKYGYAEDFDGKGAGPSGQIDFAAIDAALLALDAAARQNDGRIARIFFAPDLQQYLSPQVRGKFQFNKNPSWVRHDDHYHIDFEFACSGT